jgi:hypothetical protein
MRLKRGLIIKNLPKKNEPTPQSGLEELGAINKLSGRRELNPGPLAPHASALAGLRYAPIV